MSTKFNSNKERQEHLVGLLEYGGAKEAQLKLYEWVKTGVFEKKDFDEALDNFRCFRR